MPGRVSTRLELLSSVRGNTLVFPDLWQYCSHWPQAVNPGIDQLRKDVSDWLDKAIPSEKLREAYKIADIGLLGACVYPFASYDRLRIAALLNIWVFIVDDELDMESGTMVDDLETSNKYRSELIDFVRRCLGLAQAADDDAGSDSDSGSSNTSSSDSSSCAVKDTAYGHIIQSFAMLGREIQDKYNVDQRQRLLDNVIFYLGMTREEQCSRLAGGIPTSEEYWKFRDGASAVEVCLAMVEYLAKAQGLPKQVFEDEDMKRLWTLTNTNVSLVNDVFSAKKELAGESIANAIPIWFAAAQPGEDRLKAATDRAVALFVQTVGEIDEVERKLMQRYGNGVLDENMTKELQWFINGCRTWCTGNYYWSLRTPRYGRLGKTVGKNGCLYIPL
ncbi:Terpene synthase [Lasiodiplodia theobromae]|uniref:Terpene synthase n=1 Tax=Lasiodiplodia theobromae TaxID=45133 RepID=UPI0015C2E163|nr:Terpene synthase [Lasiodiplodia theobromae]KAF4535898.1 Terpene synthase [Lasiodiplodia theobromae]